MSALDSDLEKVGLTSAHQQPFLWPDEALENLDAILPFNKATMIPQGHPAHLLLANGILCS